VHLIVEGRESVATAPSARKLEEAYGSTICTSVCLTRLSGFFIPLGRAAQSVTSETRLALLHRPIGPSFPAYSFRGAFMSFRDLPLLQAEDPSPAQHRQGSCLLPAEAVR
jgi:hypothetical protein